ncbi:MAG: alanine racemase [Anaerolineae bacterium]|nr:alanine racemase [Anaerolineae bacterium]
MFFLLDAGSPANVTATTWIEVDLDAIAHNVRAIKAHVGPDTAVMAVVKANAYGHGALPVALAALHGGAERLAVARVEEGLQLRAAGVSAPVLVMGYTPPAVMAAAIQARLTVTITEYDVLQAVAEAAQRQAATARVHVKLDTGMGRFGLLPEEAVSFLQRAAETPGVMLEGVFTHFAAADALDKAYTQAQFAVFQEVLALAEKAGLAIPLRHVANSAATLDLPAMHLDAVRPGIAIYGLHPSDESRPPFTLKPALALKSRVARVRTLPQGASISYGRTYITPRAMPVALIPVGYGDGYPRLLSSRGAVLINGRHCPILGRVCMDQFVVDITHAGAVRVGDEVVVIGAQGEARIPAEEVARLAQTINYEITTGLTARPPRWYRATDPALRSRLEPRAAL